MSNCLVKRYDAAFQLYPHQLVPICFCRRQVVGCTSTCTDVTARPRRTRLISEAVFQHHWPYSLQVSVLAPGLVHAAKFCNCAIYLHAVQNALTLARSIHKPNIDQALQVRVTGVTVVTVGLCLSHLTNSCKLQPCHFYRR